jgi:hypothetical protein
MFTTKLKTTLAIAGSIIVLIGAVFAFSTTFATNERVDKVEITTERNVENKMKDFEEDVAGALQNQQIKSDYRFYQFQYDKILQDKMEVRRQLRRNPEDQGLRQDYQELEEERKRIKQKMDELMNKIN